MHNQLMKHRQNRSHLTAPRLVGIAQSAEAASIGLLAAIDGTIDALQGITEIMSGLSKMLAGVCDSLKCDPIEEGVYLDPDDIAIDSMARSAAQLDVFLRRLVIQRGAIDKDRRLKDHHCTALQDAYESAITEVAELIESLIACRSAIIAHDLAAEPRASSPGFKTVTSLIASLRNGQ